MLITWSGNKTLEKGFLLIEIIIAIAVISFAMVALLGMGSVSISTATLVQKTTQADDLIKEELEAVRNYRDGTTWSSNGIGILSTGSSNKYHASISSGKWVMNSGTETTGVFTRYVYFDTVSRDPTTNNIESVYNSAHNDSKTRKVTAIVSWNGHTWTVVTYLTDW